MNCSNCGANLRPADKFCAGCGASREPTPPSGPSDHPPPRAQPQAPSATHNRPTNTPGQSARPSTTEPPLASTDQARKGRGCCGWGCMVVAGLLVILLVIVGGVIAVRTNIPVRLGLRQSPVERLLSGQPDRQAAQTILDELTQGGMDTQGMWLYVLPIEGQSYSLAYALLDASEGFQFDRSTDGDGITALLVGIATTDAADAHGIGRVAIEYQNLSDKRILTLTAPTQAIRDFADGNISRNAFMQVLEGDFDPQELYGEFLQ